MTKNALREAAFNNPPVKRVEFEYNGQGFELLAPTVRRRRDILQKQEKDNPSLLDIQIWVAIECTVEPGTTTRIFEDTDLEAFENMTMNGFIDAVGEHCLELINVVTPSKKAKASTSKTPTSSS